jgi:hypothetical protein
MHSEELTNALVLVVVVVVVTHSLSLELNVTTKWYDVTVHVSCVARVSGYYILYMYYY